MSDHSLFALVVGGFVMAGFVATGARALREFSRHDLRDFCRRKKSPDRFGEILRRYSAVAQGAENLAILVTTLLVVAGTFWISHRMAVATEPSWRDLLATWLALGLTVSVVKLWIPWAVVELWAEPFLYYTWSIWTVIAKLMQPFVRCGHLFDVLFHRLAGRNREVPNEESLEEEIRTIVSEGHREGLLEEEAREMIEGIIELGDATVSEIMTPRTDMHMLRADMSWKEMLQVVIETGHTRTPVFDKNRDDVIGILHSKDLLPELASGNGLPPRPLAEILRKPYFVPETKAIDDLLQEFQETGNHMAVVLDEYGGVSGLVTIEDVLEEIVGEIVDEYDEGVVEEIHRIDDRVFEALGKAHTDEINEKLGISLPENGDFDTIGGFVFSELGRIPAAGESVPWKGQVRVTVLEASPRRIERVRIEILDQQEKEIA